MKVPRRNFTRSAYPKTLHCRAHSLARSLGETKHEPIARKARKSRVHDETSLVTRRRTPQGEGNGGGRERRERERGRGAKRKREKERERALEKIESLEQSLVRESVRVSRD